LDKAEQVARTITEPDSRAKLLTRLAGILVGAGHTVRAGQVAEEAERAAGTITSLDHRAGALAKLAATMASADAGRARRLIAAAWTSGHWSHPLSALASAAPSALLALADEEIGSTF
jgi:hypothetical protein